MFCVMQTLLVGMRHYTVYKIDFPLDGGQMIWCLLCKQSLKESCRIYQLQQIEYLLIVIDKNRLYYFDLFTTDFRREHFF